MHALLNDLRHALRGLARNPGFTALAVVTLALGIGAVTVLLTVADRLLVRPLAYPAPERIVMVWETPPGFRHNPVSGPNFHDWKRQARSFAALAAVSEGSFNLSGGSEPELVRGARVSASFFEVYGAPLSLGRAPRPDESAAKVAVISDSLWRQRFAASPGVLGASVLLDGEAHSVIGVLPPGHEPATRWSLGERLDVFVPFEPPAAEEQRDTHFMEVVARLADGVSLAQAQGEMSAVASDLERRYPDSNRGYGARVAPLKEELVGWSRTPLLILLGAASLVLVLASANVAGMLLARNGARGAELAVRACLGAGGRRIAVQLLVECVPLLVLAGALGLAGASWGLHLLPTLLPAELRQAFVLAADWRSVVACVGLTLASGVLVGVPAAFLAPRREVAAWLRSGRGEAGRVTGRHRLRGTLVVAQVALGLVLANAAVLLLASLARLLATEQGFDAERILTARLQLVGPRYAARGQVPSTLHELFPRLASLPGVREAAFTTKLPLLGGNNGTEVVEGREGDFGPDGGPQVERSTVSASYFRTMGIPLLEGRLLSEADGEAHVAVINRTFARLGWPGGSALGKRFGSEGQWFTVVGVVGDVRQWGPERPPRPELYRLFTSSPRYETEDYIMARPYVLLRTQGEPSWVAAALREAVRGVDPDQPVSDLRTMQERVDEAGAGRRFLTVLISALACAALLLVATGLYGLLATIVSARSHEIGVRMALGADARSAAGLVLRRMLRLAAAGASLGLAGALASAPLLGSLLYEARATDPWLLGAGVVVLMLTAVLGAAVPAMRAARMSPTAALRAQ